MTIVTLQCATTNIEDHWDSAVCRNNPRRLLRRRSVTQRPLEDHSAAALLGALTTPQEKLACRTRFAHESPFSAPPHPSPSPCHITLAAIVPTRSTFNGVPPLFRLASQSAHSKKDEKDSLNYDRPGAFLLRTTPLGWIVDDWEIRFLNMRTQLGTMSTFLVWTFKFNIGLGAIWRFPMNAYMFGTGINYESGRMVWYYALEQAMYSVGVAFGPLIMFGSYACVRRDVRFNIILSCVLVIILSVLASMFVFEILGIKASASDESIANFTHTGPHFVFVVYSEAFNLIAVAPNITRALFYFVFVTTAANNSVATVYSWWVLDWTKYSIEILVPGLALWLLVMAPIPIMAIYNIIKFYKAGRPIGVLEAFKRVKESPQGLNIDILTTNDLLLHAFNNLAKRQGYQILSLIEVLLRALSQVELINIGVC
uniref:Sodium-dependent nutrient amino acid transporter 1 n=1 Tax=Timema bartmani TaxID=61472 RepID=A0A7R9EYQ9_9NEOP|nr:unnamed protein product [Timema bartmani]